MTTLLLVGSRVDGLALASQSRALYYTDSHQNQIVMMSLEGKSRKVLRNQNLSSPRAIVVDERSGYVCTYLCFRQHRRCHDRQTVCQLRRDIKLVNQYPCAAISINQSINQKFK